jgi:alanyl-tRNA synthetase
LLSAFRFRKIGKDDIHLSFFEMPGAFNFEQNNKTKNVRQMWKLATSVLGIKKRNFWASYFSDGSILGNELPENCTVREAWLDVGLPSERIIGLGKKDNYCQRSTVSG